MSGPGIQHSGAVSIFCSKFSVLTFLTLFSFFLTSCEREYGKEAG